MVKPKKKPVKSKEYWYLSISYSCAKYKWGSLDEAIIKSIGAKYESGAGTGFGYRDVGFVYETRKELNLMFRRLPRLRAKYTLKYELTHYPTG